MRMLLLQQNQVILNVESLKSFAKEQCAFVKNKNTSSFEVANVS
ncbi:hypothetical protein [Helicobacter turcicus]|nr:hypothetical protein [Helicobacter turcicus]